MLGVLFVDLVALVQLVVSGVAVRGAFR